MQKSARMKILVVGTVAVLSAAGSVAEAAPVRQFDVGYGWDAAFAYGQAEPLGRSAEGDESDSIGHLQASPVELTLGVQSFAPRRTVPVPGSLVLFGSGLVMLAFAARRTHRRPVLGIPGSR